MKFFTKPFYFFLGLGFVGILGLVQHFIDPDDSLVIFYLLPLFFVTWFVGKKAGMLLALELSELDPLTEIRNRRYFTEFLQAEIYRSLRYDHPFTLIFVDIDHFKKMNENFGHSIGDAILKVCAKTLKQTIRSADTLSRMGPDEFAILLPETDYPAAQFAIRRIHKNILDAFKGKDWPITLSFGALTYAMPPSTADTILKRMDQLMMKIKNSGNNKINHESC